MDSQIKAQNLASTILSSSTPPQISGACSAVESYLQKHVPDQTRTFFSIAFPALISKIFGYDDSAASQKPASSTGWIDQIHASNDPDLSGKLFNLLSPSGILLSSIFSVDRQSLVKYIFPVERLPEWVRFALQNERYCQVLADICPLFKGRLKEDPIQGSFQIQLNVFEYYVFWFAYYPVCRGSFERSDEVVVRKNRRFRLENWASSLASGGRGVGQKTECRLYLRLLYAYLRSFVPNNGLNAYQPYRSSLLHYSSGYDGSVLQQAEFLVYTLAHFWLVDNDFSPVPVNVCRSFGVPFYPLRAVLGEVLPTAGLGEVVKFFLRFLNSSLVDNKEGPALMESGGSPRWQSISGSASKLRPALSPFSCGGSVGSWNSVIQRPLYSSLVVHFLGFAHKFLHANTEMMIQMVLQLLNILTSSNELVDLLKKVDAAYHSKPAGSSPISDTSYRSISSIREQLQDWEDGLCESDADGSFLHENWNSDLRLFCEDEDGGHQLLQLFILRAQHEIRAFSGENLSQNLQKLDSLKAQMSCLFGGSVGKPSNLMIPEPMQDQHGRDEVFTPKHPGVGKRTWADVKYKGDSMKRPISDGEVAWLARLLVRLSYWLNENLGLDQQGEGSSDPSPSGSFVEVSSDDTCHISGAKDALWVVLSSVGFWLVLFCHMVVNFMRKRRLRINLRGLASKKVVTIITAYVVFSVWKKVLGMCHILL
ncbi:hypothetical protein AAC387_Pa06g0078 [Persea americana]